MVPTTRATVRLADKSSPSVLPGRRRRGLVRLLVAGLGLLLAPALVARWVPWLLPLDLVLGKRLLMEQIVSFTSGGIKGFLSVG